MWIDETYVGFNVSQTSNVNNWIAYKWGELDGSYYYFLNKNSQNQLMELTPPDDWDGIDYSFLNSNEFSVCEECNSIPSMYQIIYGEIVSLMNYGVFIELEEGVEGLIHISEMSWIRHIKHPSDMFQVGDKITALNGFSLYHKDISTVLSDFDYEKKTNAYLTLSIN